MVESGFKFYDVSYLIGGGINSVSGYMQCLFKKVKICNREMYLILSPFRISETSLDYAGDIMQPTDSWGVATSELVLKDTGANYLYLYDVSSKTRRCLFTCAGLMFGSLNFRGESKWFNAEFNLNYNSTRIYVRMYTKIYYWTVSISDGVVSIACYNPNLTATDIDGSTVSVSGPIDNQGCVHWFSSSKKDTEKNIYMRYYNKTNVETGETTQIEYAPAYFQDPPTSYGSGTTFSEDFPLYFCLVENEDISAGFNLYAIRMSYKSTYTLVPGDNMYFTCVETYRISDEDGPFLTQEYKYGDDPDRFVWIGGTYKNLADFTGWTSPLRTFPLSKARPFLMIMERPNKFSYASYTGYVCTKKSAIQFGPYAVDEGPLIYPMFNVRKDGDALQGFIAGDAIDNVFVSRGVFIFREDIDVTSQILNSIGVSSSAVLGVTFIPKEICEQLKIN
jgi:hypothetical protein